MTPEVEIKFACTAGTLEALAARVFTGPGRDRRLVSVYYDTPGDDLAARGAALRLRTDDSGRTIQTLKSGTGLARREAEVETAPGRLDLDGDDLRVLLANAAPGDLIPRFTVQVRRRTCEVLRGGSRIELALDQGEILADGARETVCEAELELVSGDVRELFALAADLVADLPLTLSLRSKSDRGYRLAGGGLPVAPPAGLEVPNGQYYNPYMLGDVSAFWKGKGHAPAGGFIAMPPQLAPDKVTFDDGAKSTVDQQARDVAAFLTWASEPRMEERKVFGVGAMIYLLILAGLLYVSYRRIWRNVAH